MNSKKVLIAPLNWGLGHATRCIPVILEFYRQGAEIFIASDGRSLELLKKEFPELKYFQLGGYDIKYPENGSMVLQMILQASKISSAIKREHAELEKIAEENNIDIVFSDNRYGCRSKKAYSVFMTHQLNIQAPPGFKWAEPLISVKNKKFISEFDECWVPDFEGKENLSGILSHPHKLENIKYIGPLSRFTGDQNPSQKKYDLMVICSGPEPQRTIFEDLLTKEVLKTKQKTILVEGITETKKKTGQKKNLEIISYADSKEMQSSIESSAFIISRPGYSTIMDLVTLGKKAIFVPTPGQTEQEYLAKYLLEKKYFYSEEQSKFNLSDALRKSENYTGLKISSPPRLLNEAVSRLLSK
ncbi:MAG TPA: glycosyltransferase family protein [Bacteroidia bacterium]|nr:glycosyltransferase family protein [Bacteroidia bacterium]